MDGDLSHGYRYPAFEQPRPGLKGFRLREVPLSLLIWKLSVVSTEKRTPGQGKIRVLVPRTDVLTSGFIRFSLARIIFVSRHPFETWKALRIKKAICVVRSDSIIGVPLQVLSLFCLSVKSINDAGAGKPDQRNVHVAYKPTRLFHTKR